MDRLTATIARLDRERSDRATDARDAFATMDDAMTGARDLASLTRYARMADAAARLAHINR